MTFLTRGRIGAALEKRDDRWLLQTPPFRSAKPTPARGLEPQRLALDPELVWLAHEHEPWRPGTV
jgi:hypothetical protein